jgi:hypothetical protein
MKGRTVGVTLSMQDAQALHWLARHLAFEDALRSTPPHLGREIRSERAYSIVHAAARLEDHLAKSGAHGDSWMYEAVAHG